MIRVISVTDFSAAGRSLLDMTLPDLLDQPLVLQDDDSACADWLAVHGRHFPTDLRPRSPLRCVATPAGIARTFDNDGVSVTETILVAPDGDSALVQWSAPEAAEIDVEWSYHAPDEIAFIFSTAVEATSVQSESHTHTSAHLSMPANDAVRLLMTRHPAEMAELDPQRWLRTHAARTERRRRELLRIETADAHFDRLWDWWTFLSSVDSEAGARRVREYEQNVLGIAADAERGRLVLRPRMPRDVDTLTAHNIRVDDALIRLSYARMGTSTTFTLLQTAGAYPIRLILEPVLAAAPNHIFVDGVPATLNVRPAPDGGVIAPVQIMLDEKRVVAFD